MYVTAFKHYLRTIHRGNLYCILTAAAMFLMALLWLQQQPAQHSQINSPAAQDNGHAPSAAKLKPTLRTSRS